MLENPSVQTLYNIEVSYLIKIYYITALLYGNYCNLTTHIKNNIWHKLMLHGIRNVYRIHLQWNKIQLIQVYLLQCVVFNLRFFGTRNQISRLSTKSYCMYERFFKLHYCKFSEGVF